MKKFQALILALLMVLSFATFAACGDDSSGDAPASKVTESKSVEENDNEEDEDDESATVVGKWESKEDLASIIKDNMDTSAYGLYFSEEEMDEYFKNYKLSITECLELNADGTMILSIDENVNSALEKGAEDLAKIMLKMECDMQKLVVDDLAAKYGVTVAELEEDFIQTAKKSIGSYDTTATEEMYYEVDGDTIYIGESKSDVKYNKEYCTTVTFSVTKTSLVWEGENVERKYTRAE